jgi:hypothetical protein
MALVEFNVRVDLYRSKQGGAAQWAGPVDPESAEYLGSMTKDGFKAVALPRAGEQWLHGIGWFDPIDLVTVQAVEHRLTPPWIGVGESADDMPVNGDPSATVVIRQRAPGTGEMDQFVKHFDDNGWHWHNYGIAVAEERTRLEQERS